MNDRTAAVRSLANRVQAWVVAVALLAGVVPASLSQAQTAAATPSAVVSTAYVRGINGRIERIIQKLANGSTREMLPLYGHNGTVIGAVDGDGNPIEEKDYSAFGLPDPQTGSQQKHGFQGEYWDEDAQLLYLRGRWYDPRIGRFISADPSEGRPSDPRTLNRYSFGHNDPVHNRDPNGRMSMGELGVASDIQSVLGNLQASSGVDLLSRAMNREDDAGGGWAALASIAPLAVGPLFKGAMKITSKMGSKGKVAYPAAKPPLAKEVEAAEFIAEKRAVGVYIRGGSSAKGADFFINGAKWELKTLDKPTSNAVKTSISSGKKQADRLVIDGRKAGLTEEEAMRGIRRTAGAGDRMPSEIMIITKGDKIVMWP